ncbi:MAG TPA: DUF928 domain-containing protein [Coleofasciculaceae cyanobacterium]
MSTPILQALKRALGLSMALAVVLSGSLSLPTKVFADNSYSNDSPPTTNNRAGGSRGCDKPIASAQTAEDSSLILFSSMQTLGRTAETRPTLAWYVSNFVSSPMEFRLYEYDVASQKTTLVAEVKDKNFKSSPGIVLLSFSESMPSLSIGKRYLWQVELICDANSPSSNPFAEGEFKVVEGTPELQAQLAQAQNPFERATVYVKAGLWYDALATVLQTSMAEDDSRLQELRGLLLEKATVGEDEIQQINQSFITQVQP